MSKRFLITLFLLASVRLFLDFGYVKFLAPVFGYEGFKLAPDLLQYTASWFLYLLIIPLSPTKLRKVSDAVFMLVNMAIIAPLTSMYGLSGESVVPVLMSIFSLAFVYAIANARVFRAFRLPYLKSGERLAVLISLAAVVVVVLHYLVSGVHLNFNFAKVYDFRSENAASAGVGVFAYLNSWAFEVFNIFLIAICLLKRRYSAMAIFFGVQIFLFSASQHKSVLFAPFIVVGVWWYLRKSDNLLIIPMSILALIGVSIGAYLFNSSVMLPSIAFRRVLFTPAHLDFAYYSFFSVNPKVMWGDSSWMPLITSPYSVTIPYVIGRSLGSVALGANNGYVSSGFAQAGFFGVFVYSLILGYALKFVDNESRRLRANWFGVGLFLLPFITIWQSSDLSTSMLTHGFLVMLALLGLLRRSDQHAIGLDDLAGGEVSIDSWKNSGPQKADR